MERWQNKVAVVTGASSGIGAACCKALLAQGMIVVGLARRYERMETELKTKNNTEQLKTVLDVNVLGVALCTREAFRSMKKRNFDGHVVIVNSTLGHNIPYTPNMTFNMYIPSKFAMTAMTEVLRQEFLINETKIKVTSLSPGLVDTEAVDLTHLPAGIPHLKAEDIADALVFCLQTPPHVQIHELTIRPM